MLIEDFKNTTITLENEDQVRLFQEYVFSKGIEYPSGHDGKVKYLEERSFSIDCSFHLVRAMSRSSKKRITLDQCIPHWRDLLPKKENTWTIRIDNNDTKVNISDKIEPWSAGTYVVFIKNYGNSCPGDIDKILRGTGRGVYCEKEMTTTTNSRYTKWFATKEEAEKFSKALLTTKEIPTFIEYEQSHFRDRIEEITRNIWHNEPKLDIWSPYPTSIGHWTSMGINNHLDSINKVKKSSLELVKKKKKLLGTVVNTNNINLK